MVDFEKFLVKPESTTREVMACIDRCAKGVALVVDAQRRLIGTVTDGDIRRWILAERSLDVPASELLAHKAGSTYPKPISARAGTEHSELLALMQKRQIRQLPLLDDQGRVIGLTTLDELMPEQILPMQAVIMAGGFGTRLRPLTEELPKPMLPVGDRPLMEHIIEQLRQAGIHKVNVTTHYLEEKIASHFGDGSRFGVDLSYVSEDRPLGTAGALGLMEKPDEPILVMNGDILTRVDFRAMLSFHREHQAELTVGVRQYDLQVPYGVIECEGAQVQRVREKPLLKFLMNAGIYLLEPSALRFIPGEKRFDMTDLIERMVNEGRPVVSFPIMEYWLDIGQHLDYQQAQQDVGEGKL